MKISITGHTRGIGKCVYDIFPDALVFSRSNGYDITIPEIRKQIFLESRECDVFINNANSNPDFGQLLLLYEFWERWKDQKKIIINIGSRASDLAYHAHYPHYKYAIQKLALEGASKYMSHTEKPCKVVCIKPGFVDTESVQNITSPKIDPKEVALFIKDLLENNKTFWIPVVTLYPNKI